jgi:glucose/arabinose dehydrogenase
MGDNLLPDELNRVPRRGMHFGYPCWHGGDVPDPKFGTKRDCSRFTPPEDPFELGTDQSDDYAHYALTPRISS